MSAQIALLVPALLAAGGVTLLVGVQAAILGPICHRARVHSSFAATCLMAAGFIFSTAALHASGNIEAAASSFHWQIAFGLLFLPPFVLFAGQYTGSPHDALRRGFAFASLVAAILLVANAILPVGLRFERIRAEEPMRLPWGEVIPVYGGTPTAWIHAGRAFAFGVFAWAIWRAVAAYRAGQRRQAAMLLAYLVLQVASLVHGLLVDAGAIRSIYLPGFAFLALALIMSASLAMDLRDQARSLRRRSDELRTEMARREHAERKLLDGAYRDGLTGLPNRLRLHDLLAAQLAAARHGKRCSALLLVDLDHFRTINDALGHDVGDRVLRELAMRLDQPYLDEATVVRLGGDEFALVLSALMDCELARPRAEHVAGEIRRRLEVPLSLGFQVGAHIGIACIDGGCESELDVLRHAEMALYEAKAGRRQVAFFEPAMQESTHARMQLMHGLRGARERGELALEFQPQCDATGAACGAEALVRWFHPVHGCVPPDRFIGLAEESGLIHPIGEWVFDRACAALAGWKREGLALRGRLAVNISGWQLAHPGFVGMVRKALERHVVDPAEITLEITETVLLVDAEDTIDKLSQLRATGLHVSMDDFGTGYSSLAQLHRVPLDEIKVDKSFVAEMQRTERVKLLVETIIAAGHQLQLRVIAEGVETQEQHLMLMDAGCDLFQGYLYGRPMPEGAFHEWLRAQARLQEAVARAGNEASAASAPAVPEPVYFGA